LSTVLGIASRYPQDRLKVTFLAVSAEGPALETLESWHGSLGTDLARQLADLSQVIRNRFDPLRPDAIAVKRVESPFRKPPDHYDARVSLEAIAMLTAEHLGCRHFSYRTGELKSRFGGRDPGDVVREIFASCPEGEEAAEAAAAAYAALKDLGHEIKV
jgi:hypothetical protein